MGNPIRILHLSDIHFRTTTHWDAIPLLKELHSALEEIEQQGLRPHLIALTGDIAFSGRREEYKLAENWIDTSLLRAFPRFDRRNLLIVPGNHDISRTEVTALVEPMVEALRKADQIKIGNMLQSKDAPSLFRRHKEYLRFAGKYCGAMARNKALWWAQVSRFGNCKLGIAGLSSSLISLGDDSNDKGRLLISRFQLNEVLSVLDGVDLRVALIHHPLSYLFDEQEAALQMEENYSIMFRGHLHSPKSIAHSAFHSGFLELAAGSIYAESQYANSFQLIELDTAAGETRVHYRLWQKSKWIRDLNAAGVDENCGYATFPLRLMNGSQNGSSRLGQKTSANRTRSQRSQTPQPTSAQTQVGSARVWSRTVAKLPLTIKAAEDLAELLETIRMQAYRLLKAHEPKLANRQVRANVFLPDYRAPSGGRAYLLFMPEDFRKQMNHAPEWEIRFGTGQGAAGLAFETGQQRISRKLARGKGEWESTFQLTDELKKKVHKDLAWIVSLPLKDPASDLTLGVLNIDGLDYQFSDEILSGIALSLVLEVKVFAIALAEQPRVRLSFIAED